MKTRTSKGSPSLKQKIYGLLLLCSLQHTETASIYGFKYFIVTYAISVYSASLFVRNHSSVRLYFLSNRRCFLCARHFLLLFSRFYSFEISFLGLPFFDPVWQEGFERFLTWRCSDRWLVIVAPQGQVKDFVINLYKLIQN